jgi:alpha-tubulin suppressor-like RCC1 family protein
MRPVAVTGLTDAEDIAAGANHTCARRRSGAIVCWGGNLHGQIGDGSTITRLTPVPVSGLP